MVSIHSFLSSHLLTQVGSSCSFLKPVSSLCTRFQPLSPTQVYGSRNTPISPYIIVSISFKHAVISVILQKLNLVFVPLCFKTCLKCYLYFLHLQILSSIFPSAHAVFFIPIIQPKVLSSRSTIVYTLLTTVIASPYLSGAFHICVLFFFFFFFLSSGHHTLHLLFHFFFSSSGEFLSVSQSL